MPLFYSERVAFAGAGGKNTYPFFLVKEDLDAAYKELVQRGDVPAPTGDGAAMENGMPIGLVRVATLDGLIGQMEGGEVDLSDSVIVGSRAALTAVRQLVQG